jgi:hypothetical protein
MAKKETGRNWILNHIRSLKHDSETRKLPEDGQSFLFYSSKPLNGQCLGSPGAT